MRSPILQRAKYVCGDLIKSNYFLQYTPACAYAWHAVHSACCFVLSDGDTTGIANRSHAFHTIASHARQDNAKSVLPEKLRDRKHGDIYGGPVGGICGKVG